ncbi:MAG: type II secretion system protein GspL [Proteobacteria bacterium]|nr:type II secretion system protein GspL [Pseudomonadota bacterium]
MPDLLFVRPSVDELEWLQYDSGGSLLASGRGAVDALNEAMADFGGRCVFVVPGEKVLITRASVPARNARQLAQAIPYAIEEQIALDVEDCFFALGERGDDGAIEVGVVTRELLEGWISDISQLVPQVMEMVPASCLLDRSRPCAVVDGTRVHVSVPGSLTQTLPVSDLSLTLGLLAEQPASLQVSVAACDEDSVRLAVDELNASGIETQVQVSDHDAFVLLCAGYRQNRMNLLQGRFRVEPRRQRNNNVWRSVALLCGGAILLHVLLQAGQAWYLAAEASRYEQEARDLYQAIFPNDRNIRDLRRRWNAHLGKSGSGESAGAFLALLDQSSRGLTAAGLTLTNINFNESRGDLVLQVDAAQSDALVKYAQQLNSQGLKAEIGTITQEGTAVRGSIRVREAGARS